MSDSTPSSKRRRANTTGDHHTASAPLTDAPADISSGSADVNDDDTGSQSSLEGETVNQGASTLGLEGFGANHLNLDSPPPFYNDTQVDPNKKVTEVIAPRIFVVVPQSDFLPANTLQARYSNP
jgi:hypothetical protein